MDIQSQLSRFRDGESFKSRQSPTIEKSVRYNRLSFMYRLCIYGLLLACQHGQTVSAQGEDIGKQLLPATSHLNSSLSDTITSTLGRRQDVSAATLTTGNQLKRQMVRELRVYDDKLLAQTTTSDKVVLPDGHDPADVAGLNVDVDLHSDDQVEEDTPGGRISVNPPVQSLGQNLINLNRIWQSERYFFNRKVSPRFKDHQVIKQHDDGDQLSEVSPIQVEAGMGSVLAVLTSVVLCFVIYVNLQRKVLRPEAPAESLVPAQNADTAAGTELQSGNNEHPLAEAD